MNYQFVLPLFCVIFYKSDTNQNGKEPTGAQTDAFRTKHDLLT